MTTNTTVALLLATLSVARSVAAQTPAAPKGYFNVTFGAQPLRTTVDATATSVVFNEEATITADHRIGNGPFFEIAAGHRFGWHNLMLGLAFTSFSSKGNASGVASVPDPLFVGHFTTVPVEATDLERKEQGYHLQATWFHPMGQKADVAFSVGPSLFHVSQEFASANVDASQNVIVVPDSQSGLAFGFNLGVDGTYFLTPRFGIGLLVGYKWGTVNLPAARVNTGGLQGGLGARVRF